MRRPLRPAALSLGDAAGGPRNGPDSNGPELPPSQETGEVRSRAIHFARTGQPSTPAGEGAEYKMKSTVFRTAFLFFAVSLAGFSAQAQNNSSDAHLYGSLLDSSGAGVGGVHVTAQLEGAAAPLWNANSSADGAYGLTIPPGRYHRSFDRSPFVSRDFVLDLTPNQQPKLDLSLPLERLSARVLVTPQAEPTLGDQNTASVSVIT